MFPMPKGMGNVKLTKKEQKEADRALKDLCKKENITMVKKPKKKLDTNFTNNDPLDAVIRKMSGEPERLTYEQIKPVLVAKIDKLAISYKEKQEAFNKKYDNSNEKKDVLAVLDTMKNADPDLTITLVVESIECRKLRSSLGYLNHLLGQMRKDITYPLDSIEKIEKL